jgi:replicative DNA helicase
VLGAQFLKERRENKTLGIPVGLNDLDIEDVQGRCFLPLMPTELMTIIARPGCGKTGWMMRWARTRSQWLQKNKITNRVVAYITLEQSIEELNAFNLAADKQMSITKMAKGEITDEEWKLCLADATGRRFMPLWNIGYSSMAGVKQIRVDADSIRGALELLRETYKLELDICFVDYLQRMPYDRAESKTVGVSDNLDALKNIALTLHCPVVAGVQARREVDDQTPQIPGLDDGQWTSNIEQTSDRVISLVRPSKYAKEGEQFGGVTVKGHCQMLVSVLKQKLGPDNFSRWVYFDPVYNKLDQLETKLK